jgi:hypothetical protein
MSNVIQFEPRPEFTDYFGGCPECWRNDGYLNYGRDHWFVCHKHKVRWYVGSNLFSSWREEDEESWNENAKLLSTYREVEEVTHLPPEYDREEVNDEDIPF